MTSSWVWHSSIDALKAGEVAQAARRVACAADQPVILEIIPYYAGGASSGDAFWAQSWGDELEVIKPSALDELQAVASCRTLSDLAQGLTSLPNSEWIYLDWYLGVHVELQPLNEPEEPCWTADELWQRVLSAWGTWLV